MDKDALFKSRLPQGTVDIPGVGTVTVRGLSRHELLAASKVLNDDELDALGKEAILLSFGMVDPALTLEEIAQWQKASPAGELTPVMNRINELSGIGKDAQKEAYKSLRDDAGS